MKRKVTGFRKPVEYPSLGRGLEFAGFYFRIGQPFETGWWGPGYVEGISHGKLKVRQGNGVIESESETYEHENFVLYDTKMLKHHVQARWCQFTTCQLELALEVAS